MYEPLLLIHSWTRWFVLLAAIFFFCKSIYGWRRKIHWTSQENHFIWAFNQVFGYQVLFGLTLWIGMSPMTKAALKDPSLVFQNELVTFWVFRHPLTMIMALGVFHMGKARGQRLPIEERYRSYAITFALILALILSAIPWPWLAYGRQLFRWFL